MADEQGPPPPADTLILKRALAAGDPVIAADFLARHSGLSKGAIKQAMAKGAVWLQRGRSGRRRLRRATAALQAGDHLELYYDRQLLALLPPTPQCLDDRQRYSLWFKPAGVLAQGTDYGDHCSLERLVEQALGRPTFLIHRLDREASGLMVIGHTPQAAARLSQSFQQRETEKFYRCQVIGDLAQRSGPQGRFEQALDGKASCTLYEVESCNQAENVSTVRVSLVTGRLHQIRRHFALAGFPLLGDPRYGRGNKDAGGLRLQAVSLQFPDPFNGQLVKATLPPDLLSF